MTNLFRCLQCNGGGGQILHFLWKGKIRKGWRRQRRDPGAACRQQELCDRWEVQHETVLVGEQGVTAEVTHNSGLDVEISKSSTSL